MYITEKILTILRNKKPKLKVPYPISEWGIFSSYAGGDRHSGSDIDILVDFDGRMGVRFIKLAYELEDLFKQKVDLFSRRELSLATYRSLKKI